MKVWRFAPVAPEPARDQEAGVPQAPQEPRRHPGQVRVLLQDQEAAQQSVRVAAEGLVVDRCRASRHGRRGSRRSPRLRVGRGNSRSSILGSTMCSTASPALAASSSAAFSTSLARRAPLGSTPSPRRSRPARRTAAGPRGGRRRCAGAPALLQGALGAPQQRPSSAVSSPPAISSDQEVPSPAARAIHSSVCRSRQPARAFLAVRLEAVCRLLELQVTLLLLEELLLKKCCGQLFPTHS